MANEINQVKNILKKNGSSIEKVHRDNDFENISARSEIISAILENYKDQQKERNTYKFSVKKVFVPVFSLIALVFAIATFVSIILSFMFLRENTGQFITTIVSSLVGGFSTIGSIMLIIVNYIFPNDEEKNFNDLISIIVKNDTERLNNINHNTEDN